MRNLSSIRLVAASVAMAGSVAMVGYVALHAPAPTKVVLTTTHADDVLPTDSATATPTIAIEEPTPEPTAAPVGTTPKPPAVKTQPTAAPVARPTVAPTAAPTEQVWPCRVNPSNGTCASPTP